MNNIESQKKYGHIFAKRELSPCFTNIPIYCISQYSTAIAAEYPKALKSGGVLVCNSFAIKTIHAFLYRQTKILNHGCLSGPKFGDFLGQRVVTCFYSQQEKTCAMPTVKLVKCSSDMSFSIV